MNTQIQSIAGFASVIEQYLLDYADAKQWWVECSVRLCEAIQDYCDFYFNPQGIEEREKRFCWMCRIKGWKNSKIEEIENG
jgi:hypothetical protein